MKQQCQLGKLTLLSIGVTGAVLYCAGWFQPPAGPLRYARNACALDSTDDDMSSEAADRYRQQRSRHWRNLMYQPK